MTKKIILLICHLRDRQHRIPGLPVARDPPAARPAPPVVREEPTSRPARRPGPAEPAPVMKVDDRRGRSFGGDVTGYLHPAGRVPASPRLRREDRRSQVRLPGRPLGAGRLGRNRVLHDRARPPRSSCPADRRPRSAPTAATCSSSAATRTASTPSAAGSRATCASSWTGPPPSGARTNPHLADPAQHPEAVFKFWLEDIRFDLDLAHLFSDGPVTIQSPDATMEGRGLEMVWNEVNRRITKLRIAEGKRATFRSSSLLDFGGPGHRPRRQEKQQEPARRGRARRHGYRPCPCVAVRRRRRRQAAPAGDSTLSLVDPGARPRTASRRTASTPIASCSAMTSWPSSATASSPSAG